MKIKSSSSKLYRGRLACLVLCMLSAVICSPVRAGGSWLVDGRSVQSLEVQSSNSDPNALYVDGSRPMLGALQFDPALSSSTTCLIRAYSPWDEEMYDFFVIDETQDALHVCRNGIQFFPTRHISIYNDTLWGVFSSTGIDIGDTELFGGTWMVDAVGSDPRSIISRAFADNRYTRAAVSNEHVTVYCYADDPQEDHKKIILHAVAPGVGDVTATVDPEEGFVVDDQWGRAVKLGSASMRLGTNDTEIEILGSEVFLYPDATDPDHALNQRTGDARYILRSEGVTTNYTLQAGDVLQIQNGIITAINP